MSHREPLLPPPPLTDNRPLWDIWLSGFQLPALTVADELGIFAHLERHPSTSKEIGHSLELSERSAEALLNLLAALGFLVKRNDMFHLNDLSRSYLLPESPHYWGGVLHTVRDMPVSHAMIMEAIRCDSSAEKMDSDLRKFTDDWKNSTVSSDQARSFTAKMHSHGFAAALALSRNHEFDGVKRLLDIGGGSGCYSIALAAANPLLECTVIDLPQVCQHTRDYIETYGLSGRIEVVPLDMFSDVWPSGYDAVFMSDVLHDWRTNDCIMMAQRAYDSLLNNGRIFIHEALLEDNGIGPVTANSYSLAMLMVTEGKQFTSFEILSILDHAGFSSPKISAAYGYYTLISGTRN